VRRLARSHDRNDRVIGDDNKERQPVRGVCTAVGLMKGSAFDAKREPVRDNQDNYSVRKNGTIVGRIFKVPVAPETPGWWRFQKSACFSEIRTAPDDSQAA
jgi:hypothetical protein